MATQLEQEHDSTAAGAAAPHARSAAPRRRVSARPIVLGALALALVAALERESEHPLARAVVRHVDQLGGRRLPAVDFTNVPGHGATATVDGHRVVVGSARLLDGEGGRLRLVLTDRTLELPASTRAAVTALLQAPSGGRSDRPHTAGDLPGLDAADGIVLVCRLLREAVLVPA